MEVFVADFSPSPQSRTLTVRITGCTQPPQSMTVLILNVMVAYGDTVTADSGGFLLELDMLLDVVPEITANILCLSRYKALMKDATIVTCDLSSTEGQRLKELMPPKRGWNWTPDDLIFGEQGFIFFRNGSNRLIDQHQGLLPLSAIGHAQWAKNLLYRADLAKRAGIPVFTAVIPNKETIYNRYIPKMTLSDNRAVCQIEGLAAEIGLESHFLRPEHYLIEQSLRPEMLYDRSTAYWNALGALHAFNYMAPCVAAALEIEIPLFEESELRCSRFIGVNDWGGVFAKPVINNTPRYSLRQRDGVMLFDNGIHNRGHCRIYRNKVRQKKLLAFCDSFTFNVLWQFLAERFGVVVLAHQSAVDARLVELVKPDAVMTLTIERFLINPPDDFADVSFLSLPETLNKGSADDLVEHIDLVAGI